MKSLKDIIEHIDDIVINVEGSLEVSVENISHDSREITPRTLFIALEGSTVDGTVYISDAISSGAVCVFSEKEIQDKKEGITYVVVQSLKENLSRIASFFYDYPSTHMKIIGVTGTNGKTTIATTLHSIFSELGYTCGLVSTIENKIGGISLPTKNTTPDGVVLQKLFCQMYKEGCSYVFMEVSSHALALGRVAGVQFTCGIFTNLSHDHISFHGDFETYASEKRKLFQGLSKDSYAIINIDDPKGDFMLSDMVAEVVPYSISEISAIEHGISSTNFTYKNTDFTIPRAGKFNIYNTLACIKVCEKEGIDLKKITSILENITPVPGRFELLSKNGVTGIVDYAHTSDALENVLQTIADMDIKGSVITVCGAGGDRDTEKRPLMGKIACNYSDYVIFTNDNPRTEDPEKILNDIVSGLSDVDKDMYEVVPNRKEAISKAKEIAETGDVILIAGKGHETYQEIHGERFHFDDKEEFLK